jgi:hypothetical protein
MKRANKCVASKKSYFSKTTCLRVIEKVYKTRKVKLRYYECPVCLDYHLTSKGTPAELNAVKKEWGVIEFKNNHERARLGISNRKIKEREASRVIVEKQYREFKRLFNAYCRDNGIQNKKPPTILKGVLPRAERLRILAEMKKPWWQKMLSI